MSSAKMSDDEYRLKGFPGDGDSSIVLHHAHPSHWTRKATVISAVLVLLLVAAGAAVFSRY